MKNKDDFVTNSSSTSFIIASKNKELLKTKIEIEVDLSKYTRESFSDSSKFTEFWTKEMYREIDEEDYIKSKSLIEQGHEVSIIHVSDEEDPLETLLCYEGLNNLKLPEGVTIIQGEGGY